MKAFKIAQLLAVTMLLVGGSSMYAFFGRCGTCCNQRQQVVSAPCCKKASCATVKLPIDQVQYQKVITESCGQPPTIKYHVTKEVIPCANKNTERVECFTTCPIYGGTFDAESGDRID